MAGKQLQNPLTAEHALKLTDANSWRRVAGEVAMPAILLTVQLVLQEFGPVSSHSIT